MSTAPPMPEKQRARMQKSFAAMMEPNETVVCGLPNQTVPFAVLVGFMMLAVVGALLLVPVMISRGSTVVQTDRHIYVFKTGVTGKPSEILYKTPLGTATAEVAGGRLTSYLLIGEQKIWLNANGQIQTRARIIATAATDGTAAPTTPASSAATARA